MIEDVAYAIQVFRIVQIAAVVDDGGDLLRPLRAAQMAHRAVGPAALPDKIPAHIVGSPPFEPRDRFCQPPGIEAWGLLHRETCHRHSRRAAPEPTQPAVGIRGVTTQCAALRLDIYGIEMSQRAADLFDV